MEVELKLLIDEADVETLAKLPLIEAVLIGEPVRQRLKNVYFDTPDLALYRFGAELRVRHVDDGRRLQTFKAAGVVSAGLHQREEWEVAVAGDQPDISVLRHLIGPDSAFADLLAQSHLSGRLQRLFFSAVTRTVRNLRLADGTEVEMVIDHGTIEHEEDKEPISEIELELKSGGPESLYDFALELLDSVPMRICTLSKAARGYAMALPKGRKVVKAARVRLTPDMSVEETFECIVANCMEQVNANESGVIRGNDPESLHQMRVGLRRLRSALGVFEGVIACPDKIQDELKWVASELGKARDWEVLEGSTLSLIEKLAPKDVNMGKLKEGALEHARENREIAAKAVNSARYARLQLRFAQWLLGKPWRHASLGNRRALDRPVKKFATAALKRGEERLLKRGKHLKENEPELNHRMRIAGKKMRYMTEFFGSLYPKQKVKPFVASLSDLQRELGWLNDATVGIERLGSLGDVDGDAASAAFSRGYLSACVHAENPGLARAWKKFSKADAPYMS